MEAFRRYGGGATIEQVAEEPLDSDPKTAGRYLRHLKTQIDRINVFLMRAIIELKNDVKYPRLPVRADSREKIRRMFSLLGVWFELLHRRGGAGILSSDEQAAHFHAALSQRIGLLFLQPP